MTRLYSYNQDVYSTILKYRLFYTINHCNSSLSLLYNWPSIFIESIWSCMYRDRSVMSFGRRRCISYRFFNSSKQNLLAFKHLIIVLLMLRQRIQMQSIARVKRISPRMHQTNTYEHTCLNKYFTVDAIEIRPLYSL